MSGEQYDADYFLHGKETGKSLYENYRWMPELTIPMVEAITQHLGMRHLLVRSRCRILDFGCARGYIVKALRQLRYEAYGVDISPWAIANADEEVREYVGLDVGHWKLEHKSYNWVIAKDVLEHIPQVADTINNLMDAASVGVFAVVPLGYGEDGYIVPEYDLDVTHIHRMTLQTWAGLFMRPGWSVDARYRVPGVKDNYAQYPTGNGFITARRI